MKKLHTFFFIIQLGLISQINLVCCESENGSEIGSPQPTVLLLM